jgi:hypothetical protein
MSVTVTPAETDECDHPDCSVKYAIPNAVGGYCSQECADRHAGHRLLQHLQRDHRICWSCWRPRKEIERPTDEQRRQLDPVTDQAVVGYEYLTEHADMGPHGIECTCGAVGHDIDDYDRRHDAPYHWLLREWVRETRAEGQHDKRLDLATFADVLWETGDLVLALGRALTDP